MFDDLFNHKKPNTYKLADFGFTRSESNSNEAGSCWEYQTDVMSGEFHLLVHIDEQGKIDTDLIEAETGDEYELYKTNASGAYVGEVREAISKALADIAEKCFDTAVYKTDQASLLIERAGKEYGSKLEFLWPKLPDYSVLRRNDNDKWYAVIMIVAGHKLGLETDDKVEIIDFRIEKDEKAELLALSGYYPGWHMNKESWFTVVLDGTLPDSELIKRMGESYELAGK
ncbi:MAG: MmcQ/YjbR family DNA-binding protein [Eubacteriales bacterium]|nr:MmcQ/YjbR family DNA-binding protein [Eubacteriales bacterium]